MNFLPLLVVKKRNLRHHGCRSGFSLYFELGSCQRANFRSYASLPGACPSGQTILQWCFSCLWHALLSCTQWVASWQERNLFRGGCQRWLATLSKAFSSKISLFLALSLCSSVCNSHLCPLLQPTPTQKKIVSCLSFPFDRFPSLSSLATPKICVLRAIKFGFLRVIFPTNRMRSTGMERLRMIGINELPIWMQLLIWQGSV